MWNSERLRRVTWLALAIGLMVGRPAAGSPYQQGDKILDVQLFRPGTAPNDFYNVKGAGALGHGDLFLSGYFSYMRSPLKTPLVLVSPTRRSVVQDQLSLELAAAIGLWHRLIIGVSLPFSIRQTCVSGDKDLCQGVTAVGLSDQNFDGGGLGDLRIDLRGTILKPKRGGFGLAVGATVSFPTADATAFVGEGNLSNLEDPSRGTVFSPTGTFYVAGEYRVSRLRLGLDVGYLLRRDRTFRLIDLRDQVLYGLAAEVRIVRGLSALAEINGWLSVPDTTRRNSPHEVLVGARYRLKSLRFDVGAGAGLLGDYGAPDVRIFAGIAYSGPLLGADSDGDKIPDSKDRCPNEPEDIDGFEDSDGCPDWDNDGDGIPDALDVCPNVAAVTADGCPLKDSDGDQIPDDRDRCPNEPEDVDGFEDDDGCPDPDNDKDGICDPWVEKSGQAVKYAKICHGSDRCPDQPETFNGYKDEDGCPDELPAVAKPKLPEVTPTAIVIGEKINFALGKAILADVSKPVLDSVAQVMSKHPEIRVVRVEGHTDNVGGKRRNQKISTDRARSVMKYLVSKGVSAKRLQAAGYGSTRPIVSNDTKEGRAKNRRVEFIIVERKPQ
jgi:outer membrane protein OmpA-like peptidoglycan-associated protein